MTSDWSFPDKQLPCQSTSPKLALLLCLVAAALLAMLFGSKSTKRHGNDDKQREDLIAILDFFEKLDKISTHDERGKNLGMTIRYLDQFTKQSIRMRQMEDRDGFQDDTFSVMHVKMIEAAMLAVKIYHHEDKVIYMALTVLTLIVNGHDGIQRPLWEDPNNNHIEFIITVLRDSLNRAKMDDDPSENNERLSAEVQRKGCLFLGGFDNIDASAKIIELGGLHAINDAIQWYRFHAGVCKWGLWAAFNLCYDRPKHQLTFVQIGGVQSVCQCLKNNATCADVARHGIAILFDIMRETAENAESSTQAKMIGFHEGLQDLLIESMDNFPKDVEIRMMIQQILGTAETLIPDKNLYTH